MHNGSELNNFSIGPACFDSQLAMYQNDAAGISAMPNISAAHVSSR
jgi:hypothetical protein